MFRKYLEQIVEYTVFASRWIQAPIYLGLIAGTVIYCVQFLAKLVQMPMHMGWNIGGGEGTHMASEEMLMLDILGLVDMSMVANLVYMVVVGGYTMFVSNIDIEEHPDRPEWLDTTNANTLKIK